VNETTDRPAHGATLDIDWRADGLAIRVTSPGF